MGVSIASEITGLKVGDFDLGKSAGLGIIRALQGLISFLINADVAELVDALDLGSSIARCGSSSLPIRTIEFSVWWLVTHFMIDLTIGCLEL
jgi:hypothetical protein